MKDTILHPAKEIYQSLNLVYLLSQRRPFKEAVIRNAFARFEKGLDKALGAQLEGFKEEEYLHLEELREKFEWLDDITSDVSDGDLDLDDEEEGEKVPIPHKARRYPRGK